MNQVLRSTARWVVGRGRRARSLAIAASLAIVACTAMAAPAAAEYEITSLGVASTTSQAGAHPDVTISFRVTEQPDPFFIRRPTEDLRTLEVQLPPGLIGNAAELPTCARIAFANRSCPLEAQVGVLYVETTPLYFVNGRAGAFPIYNLAPGPDRPAALGINVGGNTVPLEISVRTGEDYGLTTSSSNITAGFPIIGMDITLWAVPADPSNDEERGSCGASQEPDVCPVTVPRKPFMVNPTECSTPTAGIRLRSYQQPDRWLSATDEMATITGCENLEFKPSVSIHAENPVADKTSATSVAIGIPHNNDPDGLGSPALRRAIVQMPPGVTINPAVADGRVACSDSAFGRRNAGPSSCPAGSKVGTFSIDVPALPRALPGDIYLGEPVEGDPFRIFLYAEGQGTRVKLGGSILPNPETGRITANFDDNPQVPFRSISLRFAGGNRGVLLMPPTCGIGEISAGLTPYSSSSPTIVTSALQIMQGCAERGQPFAPVFEAGTVGAGAGKDTSFVVRFGRPDGHKTLSRLKMNLPAGLLGRLTAVPLCPNDQANAGTCSEASLVGGTTVSAGSGESPLNVPGRVYLTEPPKPGQIAGLSIVVPAAVGPYHLGTPVVRAGITVNPDTSLTIESDPLPTILHGVQLRIKQVIVNMDRPGFMFNPTDCSPKLITGSLTSTDGTEVGVESPFAVRGCTNKPLEGKVSMSLTAPPRDGGVSGLTFNLGGLPGHSNVRQIQAILPSGVGARLDGPLQTPCKEADYAADTCAASSRIGKAKAVTPVLPEPLAGDVFFIENPGGNRLPRIGMKLKGAIQLDVVGDVEITRAGRVVSTFSGIPDVPISDFQLQLDSGAQGVLASSKICGKTNYANVDVIGHTGKQVKERIPVTVTGCSAKKGKKGKRRGGNGNRS